MATSRIDGVKAPQHFKTPRSHAHARVEEVAHVVEVVEGDEIRTEGEPGDDFYLIEDGEVKCTKKAGAISAF